MPHVVPEKSFMVTAKHPSTLTLIYISLLDNPKLSFNLKVYDPPLNPVHVNGYIEVPPVSVPGIILSIVYGGTPPVGVIVKLPRPVSQVPVSEKL